MYEDFTLGVPGIERRMVRAVLRPMDLPRRTSVPWVMFVGAVNWNTASDPASVGFCTAFMRAGYVDGTKCQ